MRCLSFFSALIRQDCPLCQRAMTTLRSWRTSSANRRWLSRSSTDVSQHVIDVVKAYPNGKVLSQIKAMQHVLNKNEMSVFFQRPYSTGLPPLPAGYDNTKELTDKLCKQTLAVKKKPNKRLPSSYLCHLCFIKGHFIQDCSLVNYVWMFEWSVAIYNAITYIDL